MRRHHVRMRYIAAVGCGLILLIGCSHSGEAQQVNRYVFDPPIPDQTVATAALHYRFTPPLADRLDKYVDLLPASRLWEILDGDRIHSDYPPASQWRGFIPSVMRVMWHLAAARPTATTGCVRLIERPSPGARDRFGNLYPGEIPGSRVWVRALSEVRRYQSADFYASDKEEIQRYTRSKEWLSVISDNSALEASCPRDPNIDRWPGTTTGAFPTDRNLLTSPYLSTERLTRLRYVLRDGVSCPASKCESAEGFILRPVDLNGDGKMEYIVVESWRHCGTGGCSTTLIAFQETMWVRLAEASNIDVLTTSTKGYSDIVLGWKDYRWDDINQRWRGIRFTWDGSRYVESAQRGELSVISKGALPYESNAAALIIPPSRSPDADER